VSIREKIDLKKHGRAVIRAEKDKIIIEPIKFDFLSLGGKFKVKKPIPAERIREHIDYGEGRY